MGITAWSFFDDPSGSGWNQSVADIGSMISDHVYPSFSTMAGSSAGSILSTSGWSGSTGLDSFGSAVWNGIQFGTSLASAAWGTTTLGTIAAGGGCAAGAIPFCALAGGMALVGGVFGAGDSIRSAYTGQTQPSSLQAAIQGLGAGAGVSTFVAASIGAIGSPGKPLGKLSYDAVTKGWTSTAGLVYGQGSLHGNRVLHALAHTTPDPAKSLHTLFNVPKNRLLPLLDEAWAKRGAYTVYKSGNWNYSIDMGRVIGTKGETALTISVLPGTNRFVTAYPTP